MYESAPHYCIMIPLMMLYLNREVSIGFKGGETMRVKVRSV